MRRLETESFMARTCPVALVVGLAFLLGAPRFAQAADGDYRPFDASRVVSVAANPETVILNGPRAVWTLLIEGRLEDGRTLDLTHFATFTPVDPSIAATTALGVVSARANGKTEVRVQVADRSLTVPVEVRSFDSPRALSFENDVVPLLSRYGCNASGCHGKAEGQNGFKLSVFGFDPGADYDALTKQDRGRRVFPAAASRSLLLRKAVGGAPHGGGVRFEPESRASQVLQDWISGGLRFGEPTDPQVVKIELTPHERVLDPSGAGPGGRQQLRVLATYADGAVVDVTALARFQSNNDSVATVDESGHVTSAGAPGQVAVMASFMGEVDVFQALAPRGPAIADYPAAPENNLFDALIDARLRKLNIVPSGDATDAEYLRRLYLDTIGVLPTAQEVRTHLADTRPDRRAQWLEELFRRPEYADYWALKWADLLRVDRQALGHKGAHLYYRWIRDNFARNVPLDQFARNVLLAEGPASESPPTMFYAATPAPGAAASTLSQVFLGVRIACAQCHHHPFDRWSQHDYYGMQAFFAPLARKRTPAGEALLAQGDPVTKHPRTGEIVFAHPLGEPSPEKELSGDRRQTLAAWMTSPNNPFFARNVANRLWAHYLGRGLVEPVDDLRATNPPSNPELLDALAATLVENKFDVRALIRQIVASRAYQRSSTPNETNDGDAQNYSRALFKRLDAEVLLDAVSQTTGVPEKFGGMPSGYRAVQLWDSNVSHYFLKLFGRPTRQSSCECERNSEASVAQVLHFMNSPAIESKLQHATGRMTQLETALPDDAQLTEELYLTFFSRYPTTEESARATEYLAARHDRRRQAAADLAWSMLNSLEFVFNR